MSDRRTIKTIYGTAKLNDLGYFQITSQIEGCYRELLHRVIYEDHFGEIPENHVIHHIDGNRTNNGIGNLQCMSKGFHNWYHNYINPNSICGRCGEDNLFYGKKHSEKTRQIISEKVRENHADFNGEKNPNSKITKEDVINIRKLKKQGIHRVTAFERIGNSLGIAKGTFEGIWYNQSWKHV